MPRSKPAAPKQAVKQAEKVSAPVDSPQQRAEDAKDSEKRSDKQVAIDALKEIAGSPQDSAHADTTITSVGKAAQVAQDALDKINED